MNPPLVLRTKMRLTNVRPEGSGECLHFSNLLPGTDPYPGAGPYPQVAGAGPYPQTGPYPQGGPYPPTGRAVAEPYPQAIEDQDSLTLTSPQELRFTVSSPDMIGKCGAVGDIYLVTFTCLKAVKPESSPANPLSPPLSSPRGTLSEQEFADGAELAREGKPLPGNASPAARRGFEETQSKLHAAGRSALRPDEPRVRDVGIPSSSHTLEDQEFAAGEALARDGNPLPDNASASVRKGFDQMTAKLRAGHAHPPSA